MHYMENRLLKSSETSTIWTLHGINRWCCSRQHLIYSHHNITCCEKRCRRCDTNKWIDPKTWINLNLQFEKSVFPNLYLWMISKVRFRKRAFAQLQKLPICESNPKFCNLFNYFPPLLQGQFGNKSWFGYQWQTLANTGLLLYTLENYNITLLFYIISVQT